ncbi:hypothetical protein GMOD_00002422 [Pyrenophora seminiperda CCB06]|uniref:Uncharacterized protein n=1 Tax=Pyrenophora seminiperda CCB06 TaxID=1302712 RepID=A0A3M7LXM7_9PLEO|nr:hypothetical protein GMOD_00002422 [Pyrenophora seminiperda CCB06]
MYCLQQTRNPDITYGPVMVDGVLVAPRRCPYCMAQGVYTQCGSTPQCPEHVERHIFEEKENDRNKRPHTQHVGSGLSGCAS